MKQIFTLLIIIYNIQQELDIVHSAVVIVNHIVHELIDRKVLVVHDQILELIFFQLSLCCMGSVSLRIKLNDSGNIQCNTLHCSTV